MNPFEKFILYHLFEPAAGRRRKRDNQSRTRGSQENVPTRTAIYSREGHPPSKISEVGEKQRSQGLLGRYAIFQVDRSLPRALVPDPNGVWRTYGWRVSELLSMRVSQVDLAQKVIRLEPGTTKNRDGREVMMTEALSQMLAALIHGKASDGHVFNRAIGKPVSDFRQTWRKACEHAGVPDLLFHDLLRTAARNLRRAGVAEDIIMKIGGWRSRSVFERYAIVNRSNMNDAILKLQESEKRAEQERALAEEQAAVRAQSGHNEGLSTNHTASRAVN